MKERIVAVIPARYASTRLPGKPLLDLGGKPMIQHVYERAVRAQVDRVLVATDDRRIRDVVIGFGGRVVMTDPGHLSGSDRVAEAIRDMNVDIVVNVQGDEPLLDARLIDLTVAPLLRNATIPMSTLAHPLVNEWEIHDNNVVKVVCDQDGFALYFSRATIPHDREGVWKLGGQADTGLLRHVGLYAYRAYFLQQFTRLKPTGLERLECLEQLRALEHGYSIRVVVAPGEVIGVDTPEDLKRVRALLAEVVR